MSDIYLQITETPTVVTLSAPVVSGALAATVTVANVVTVALDSNSLNALENVTVTVGAAVSISNFPATQTIAGTVTANPTGTQTIAGTVTANVPLSVDGFTLTTGIRVIGTGVDGGLRIQGIDPNTGSSPANLEEGGKIPVFGSVTANVFGEDKVSGGFLPIPLTDSGEAVSVDIKSAFGSGINVPISGTVTIGAGTAQIGSVTASISGTVPISISSVTVGNSVTIGSLPAISGTVTANTFAVQGTAVTTSNFTSTTASTVLASFNATREVLTIFNEGAGNLHICAGATCTTIAYQVRLSAGDYYEVPNHQTTITHSAVFATAGTARVTQVS